MLQKYLDFLLLEKKYSIHTVKAYEKDIQNFYVFAADEFPKEDVIHLPYNCIRNWIVYLSAAQLSNRSINRKCTALKSYYTFLYKIGEIEKNPMSLHKSLKIQKQVLTPFSEVEIEEAPVEVDDHYTEFEKLRNELIIKVLYVTGIRRAELINLKVTDVSFRVLEIKVLGKRNKERIIPLLADLTIEIEEYIKERSQMTDTDWLFVTQKGNKLYPTLVYRVINSYFSKVTSKVKKSPHVLRHSFATDLINNGADLNSVKQLLGHTSLAATQVYTHNSLDKIKQVYNQTHPRSVKKPKDI